MESKPSHQDLIKKIQEKRSTVCVVGLGQVGLPTALTLLTAGYIVIGYDINEELIQKLSKGESHIRENSFSELIMKFVLKDTFKLTNNPISLANSDVIIVCVPTPLDSTGYNADLIFLEKALDDVARHLNGLKLIIVESSIPPRTMKDFVIPTIQNLSSRKAYGEFLISYCPERISSGNSLEELIKIPRIIGANDLDSYIATISLFKTLMTGQVYQADTTTVELSKLAENSYRDINIAFANELAVICERSDADVMEVIRLANTHPRVNIHRPGPGVGGPCLPKDPYLLIMGHQLDRSIIRTARSINDSMPDYVVEFLIKNMHFNNNNKRDSKVLILGVAYKSDVNDTRYSPTERIISGLRRAGFVDIVVHDPYSANSFGAMQASDLYFALKQADCVIIATGHSLYYSIKPQDFKKGAIIVDTARIFDKRTFLTADLVYLSLGSGRTSI